MTSLAITSDDRYVITGSYEGSIRVFDLQKKEKIHTFDKVHKGKIQLILFIYLNPKGLVSSVVISEDRRYIASGSSDSFVYLYEMEKSSLIGTIENAHTSSKI